VKKRLFWAIGIFLFIFSVTQVASAATVLRELGRSPFAVPPIETIEDLRKVVADSPGEIRKGFEKAGYTSLYQAFSQQFPTADIKTIKVNPGEKMLWMLYRKFGKGPVRVAKDVTWAGDEPFDAFQFDIDLGDNRYDIIVPLLCVNFAIRSITPIPKEAPPSPSGKPVPPKVNEAPVCAAALSSDKIWCGETVTVDAGGSTDADGQIAAMTVAVMDAAGNMVAEHTVDKAPFVHDLEIPCGGTYSVKTTVTDNEGESASGSNCEAAVTSRKRLRPVATAGFLRMWDPANFFPIRGGLEYRITDNLSLLGMLGYNIHIDGDHGDDAISADLLLHYWINRFFIGAGIGYWEMDDESVDREAVDGGHTDLIFQTGVRVFGEPDMFNVSLFLEARHWLGVDQDDLITNVDADKLASRLGGGILFRF